MIGPQVDARNDVIRERCAAWQAQYEKDRMADRLAERGPELHVVIDLNAQDAQEVDA